MDNKEIIELENACATAGYAKWPVAFVRGAGCKIWDAEGNEYLDLYGGHCVSIIGHSHPAWVEAVASQAARLGFYSNVAYSDVRATYQQRLLNFAPAHLGRVFLCNSGAEANETAVKIAMKATGRTDILAMEGGFHGRTAGALSLTHLGNYRKQFPAVVRKTKAVRFGEISDVKEFLDKNTAAVILEPVQSMSGVRSARPDYYRELQDACRENGTLVIFDEVQTGMGRLGQPFAADFFDTKADIITLAKGIGGGIPLSAVLMTDAVAGTISEGEQGTTFGGGPLACAAGLAVLDVIERMELVKHAAEMERFARENLCAGPVSEVLGHGLLLGLKTNVPAKALCEYLFKQRILIGTSANPNVARLMPPLVVETQDFERLADALLRFATLNGGNSR